MVNAILPNNELGRDFAATNNQGAKSTQAFGSYKVTHTNISSLPLSKMRLLASLAHPIRPKEPSSHRYRYIGINERDLTQNSVKWTLAVLFYKLCLYVYKHIKKKCFLR